MPQPPLQVLLASSRSATVADDRLLARVVFGRDTGIDPDDPRELRVGLPPLLAGADSELWHTDAPVTRGWRDGIGYAHTDRLLFAQLLLPDSADMAAAAQDAYHRLLAFHRAKGYPALLRIWNFFDRLLEPAQDRALDRYQAFCAGRQQALETMRVEASALPAATAIGTATPGFLVYLVATREPGIQIENPRQVSAYHYPPDYGPKSPTFSRATLKHWASGPQLYISGTASIVGHASLHRGDVEAQADEVINNLEALIHSTREGHGLDTLKSPADLSLLKVYMRHARDLERVRERIRTRIGAHPAMLFLRGDICRDELLVEIEGLYA
jgi:chorismate lyase / 3-hydroxybenzoate synthase